MINSGAANLKAHAQEINDLNVFPIPDGDTGDNMLSTLISSAENSTGGACKGVFYWEPQEYGWWKPAIYEKLGWDAYNMGAFTMEGRPAAAMKAFE